MSPKDMLAAYAKPIPVPDDLTGPYWAAAKDHRLAIQRCSVCGHYSHPPALVCPECNVLDPSFRFETVSGRGRVVSWTVFHTALVQGFDEDVPWVNVLVELEEQAGLHVYARLVDGVGAPIAEGSPVEVVFQDITAEIALPQFKLKRGSRE